MKDTISAAGDFAIIAAQIGVDAIAIVTGFDAFLHQTITTLSDLAGVGTSIGFDIIAIVTFFDAGLGDAITASGCDTVA